jgi:predicted homoserine dehydrogenase-like protein
VIIVDNALKRRAAENKPVKVAMIGAGFMARGIANQIINSVPGMRLVAIANRTLDRARRAYVEAGVSADNIKEVDSAKDVEAAISAGKYAITSDAFAVVEAGGIDAILEITGAVEHGARVTLKAIEAGKHIVTLNADIDGTVGPLLK